MTYFTTSLSFLAKASSLSEACATRDRALKALEEAGIDVHASTTQPLRSGVASGHGAFAAGTWEAAA